MFSVAEKRFLSFFLSFLMIFLCFPAEAIAEVMDGTGSQEQVAEPAVPVEEDETSVLIAAGTIEQTATAADDGMTPEELAAGYAQQQLEAALPESARGSESGGLMPMSLRPAYEALSERELAVYEALKPMIEAVAEGATSTEFAVSAETIYGQTGWTAQDLGVNSIFLVDAEGEYILDEDGYLQYDPAAVESFVNATSIDFDSVLSALLADSPYELYWFDKQEGVDTSINYVAAQESGEWVLGFPNNQRVFKFAVGSSYAAGEYEVNPSTSTRVQNAVEEAQRVVADMPSGSDVTAYDQLLYFKNYICGEVTYDHAAADAGSASNNDPWQLVSVFDKDTNTNVVCEGYSKAFKYLCDLANFDNVSCILATGTMNGGTGAGGHMWNIVNMDDGNNYLVDVTNCDGSEDNTEERAVGYPDQLFIASSPDFNADNIPAPFGVTCNDSDYVSYQYDGSTLNVFSPDDLVLSNAEYQAPVVPDAPEGGRYFIDEYGNAHLYFPLIIESDPNLVVAPMSEYVGDAGSSFIDEDGQLWYLSGDNGVLYISVKRAGDTNYDLGDFTVSYGDTVEQLSYDTVYIDYDEVDGEQVRVAAARFSLPDAAAPMTVSVSAVNLDGPITFTDENGVEHSCYPVDFTSQISPDVTSTLFGVVYDGWIENEENANGTRVFTRRNTLSGNFEETYYYDPSTGLRFAANCFRELMHLSSVAYSIGGAEPVEISEDEEMWGYTVPPSETAGPLTIIANVDKEYSVDENGVLTPADESLGNAYRLTFAGDNNVYFSSLSSTSMSPKFTVQERDEDESANTGGYTYYLWDGVACNVSVGAYDGYEVGSVELVPASAGTAELVSDGVVRVSLNAPAQLVVSSSEANILRNDPITMRFGDDSWDQARNWRISCNRLYSDSEAYGEVDAQLDYHYGRIIMFRPTLWDWEDQQIDAADAGLASAPVSLTFESNELFEQDFDVNELTMWRYVPGSEPGTGTLTQLDPTVTDLYANEFGNHTWSATVNGTLGDLTASYLVITRYDENAKPVDLKSLPWSVSSNDEALASLFANIPQMGVAQTIGYTESIDGQDVYVDYNSFTFYDDFGGVADLSSFDAEVTLSYDLANSYGELSQDTQACFMLSDGEGSEATQLIGEMVYDENGAPIAYEATVSLSALSSKLVGIAVYEPTNWLSVNGYTLVPDADDMHLFDGYQLWYTNPGDIEGYWDNSWQIGSSIANALGYDAYPLSYDTVHLSLCTVGSEGSEIIDINEGGMADLPVTLRVQLPYPPEQVAFFHFTQAYTDAVKLSSTGAPADGEEGFYDYEVSGALKDVLGFVRWVGMIKVGDPYVSDGITYHAYEFTSGTGAITEIFQDDSEPNNRYIFTNTLRNENARLVDSSRGVEFYIDNYNTDWEVSRVTITVGDQTREIEPTGEKRAAWEGDTSLYDVYATGPLAGDVTISVETVPTFTIENGVLTDKDGNKAYKIDFSSDNAGVTFSHISLQDMRQRWPMQIENPDGGFDYYLWENQPAVVYLTEPSGAAIASVALSPADAGTAELLPEKNRALVSLSAPATLEITTAPANQLVAMQRIPSGELKDSDYKLTFGDAGWNQVRAYDLREKYVNSSDSQIQDAVRDALRELGLTGSGARYFYASQNEEEVDAASVGIAEIPATAVLTLELSKDFDTSIISLYHYDPDTGELKKLPTTLTKLREVERPINIEQTTTNYIYEVAATGTFGDLTGYITLSNNAATKITRVDLTGVTDTLDAGDELPFGVSLSDGSAKYFISETGWTDTTTMAYYPNYSSDSVLIEKDHAYQLQVNLYTHYYSCYFADPSDISVYVDGELCDGVEVVSNGDDGIRLEFAPITAVGADEKIDIADTDVAPIADQVYTGSEITPALEVSYNGDTLTKGADYTVSPASFTDAGEYEITITGMGSYTGEKTATFTISPANIEDARQHETLTMDYVPGEDPVPAADKLHLAFNGTDLVENTDYSVEYGDISFVEDKPARLATITGMGNYSGATAMKIIINPYQVQDGDVLFDGTTTQVWTGSEIEPVITLTVAGQELVLDEDYTLEYGNNIDVGTATVTATFTGLYAGTAQTTFEIVNEISDEDAAAAAAVIDLLEALPDPNDVAITDSAAIEEARSAYDALSDTAKQLVSPSLVSKLENDEAALDAINQRINNVASQIDELPDPADATTDDIRAIRNAKAAFDALSADEQEVLGDERAAKIAALAETAEDLYNNMSTLERLRWDYQDALANPDVSEEVAAASAALEEALDDAAAAQAEVDAAQAALDSAGSALASSEEELQEKEAALSSAQDALGQAEGDLRNATAQWNRSNAAAVSAERDFDERTAQLEAAETDELNARQTLEGAQRAYENYEAGSLTEEELNARIAELEQQKSALDEQYAQGSYAFFESVGGTSGEKAMAALTECTYASDTVLGDADDATSLYNMRKAILAMNRCNELRANHGLDPLVVTDLLMAQAQANANYSDKIIGHSKQFNVGENLAWNDSDSDMAFVQWYDNEKALIEQGETDYKKIGHYYNIINSSYKSTGFGICTRGTNNDWKTYSQTFSGKPSSKVTDADGNVSFTVSEYLERFDAYYYDLLERRSAVEGELIIARAMLSAIDSPASDQEQAMLQALDDAQAASDTASADLDQARSNLAAAHEALDAAYEARDEAEANREAAQQIVEDNELAVESALAERNAAAASRDEAAVAYEDAESRLDEANAANVNAASAVSAAQDAFNDAIDGYVPENVAAALARLNNATDLSRAQIAVDGATYDGSEKTPEPVVTLEIVPGETITLQIDDDYTLAYSNNTNAGNATITATGTNQKDSGYFWNAASTTFNIAQADLSDAEVSVTTTSPIVYNGAAQEPGITVTLDGKKLTADDYSVEYANNTDAGDATVTVKGKGNYTGTAEGGFSIARASIANATVEIPEQTYDGTAKTPAVTVKLNGKTLEKGKDYEINPEGFTEVGQHEVTVTGDGNFEGTKVATFKIVAANIANADVVIAENNYVYDGAAKEPSVTVTLNGKTLTENDYDVEYENNVNAGTATVTVTGKNSYTGAIAASFAISPADISKATVSAIPVQTYDGSAKTPAITVTLGGKTLVAGTDYTVGYKNNVDASPAAATLTVTGKGNYAGSGKSVRFAIMPASIASASIPAIPDQPYGSFEPAVSVTLNGKTLRAWEDYTVSYANNAKPGKASVAVVTGAGNYAGVREVPFRVRFRDVTDPSSWIYAPVYRASELGIVNGYASGNFGPHDNVTRAQLATMLWNMAGRPAAGSGGRAFSDVAPSNQYYTPIRWAASVGVVNGYPDGTFGPDRPVTRQELAAMLSNYARKVCGIPAIGSPSSYASMKDASSVASWAGPAVGWCYEQRIMSGTSDGRIMPAGNASRCQTAAMLVALYRIIQNQ